VSLSSLAVRLRRPAPETCLLLQSLLDVIGPDLRSALLGLQAVALVAAGQLIGHPDVARTAA